MTQTTEMIAFKEEQLRVWCTQALKKSCGVNDEYAFAVTDALVSANLRGVDTHGVNLLQYYVKRYKTFVPDDIRVTGDMPALCHINGGGHMGPAVSVFAMNKAMEKAASAGVGIA
ncbi:MAG: Ldh family oxidoreductase, partial [Treponema sp.]|nr:Ldh family oxidoreductase [Treponema sp.]